LQIKVNNSPYDVEVIGYENVIVNGKGIGVKSHDDEHIILDGTEFHLDFKAEGDPSLMIINGMAYLVSRGSVTEETPTGISAPISGRVIDVLASKGEKVELGQVIIVIEAMKMENEIRSPASGLVKDINVSKGQSVKIGDILVTFDGKN
jgi:biotin carboxyl carrier protein